MTVDLIYPEATPVQGNTSIVLMTAVADLDSVKLTEINAVTSLNTSCFLRMWTPEMTSNTGNAPSRVCTTVQLPVEGNTQFNAFEQRFVYDPQGDPTSDDNKAKAFLTRGVEFYALVRMGLDARETAFAIGQRYELWKFRAGRQNKVMSGTDEFAEYEIKQNWFPLTEPVDGVIVA